MYNKKHKRTRLRAVSPTALQKGAHWRYLLVLPWLLLPLQSPLAAIPAEWKNTAYAYEAEHKQVRDVLEDFAQTFGTQLQIDGLLEGNVNGKIRANTPQSLLDRLGVEHRFQWYMYNNTLYISTLDQQESARLEVSSETVADLKQALTDIGLLDKASPAEAIAHSRGSGVPIAPSSPRSSRYRLPPRLPTQKCRSLHPRHHCPAVGQITAPAPRARHPTVQVPVPLAAHADAGVRACLLGLASYVFLCLFLRQ